MAWKKSDFGDCALCEKDVEVGKVSGGLLGGPDKICSDCFEIIEEEYFKVNKTTLAQAKVDENILKKIREKNKTAKQADSKPPVQPQKPAPPSAKEKVKSDIPPPPAPPKDDKAPLIKEIKQHLAKANELLDKLKSP
jgi:hypothetical protein